MAHTSSVTLAQWLSVNSLPSSLSYELRLKHDIFGIEDLKQHIATEAKMNEIIQTIVQNHPHRFTQQHLIDVFQPLRPNEPRYDGAAVQRMIEQYIDGHQESLRLLHKEQDDTKANKLKFEQSIAEVFDAFQDKLRKQQSTYQAQFDRQFDAYQQALNGCHATHQHKLKMLRNAKQFYAHDEIDNHDRPQFDAGILQKLQKYDPKNNDVKVPADIFPSLEQQQTEMQTSFSKNIARILTLNSNDDDNKEEDEEGEEDDDLDQHEPESVAKCNRCDGAVSFMDVEDDNYDAMNGTHRKCYTAKQRPYVTRFVSSLSQYALNATGSCTVNALEAALQLQMGRRMTVKLVDEIVQLAALYQDDKHTAVSDVYPAVSRYHANLEQVSWVQTTVNNLKLIMDAASAALDQHSVTNCVSIVLTKPPETIFLHVIKQGAIYIYDSHPRPNLKGSHVLVFEGRNQAEKYLGALWPFTQLDPGFDDLLSQQINMVDVTIFQLKSGAKPSRKPDKDTMSVELQKVGVRLDAYYQKNYGQLQKPDNQHAHDGTGKNGNNDNDAQQNLQHFSEARNQIAALEIKLRDLRNQNEALKNQMAASKIEHAQKHGQLNESHFDEKQSGHDYSIGSMYGANGNNSSIPAVLNGSSSNGKDVKTFRCILCKCENNVGDVFVFQTCGCSKSCRKCSLQYISDRLKSGEWPIKCPKCFQRMNDDQDILMCDENIQAQYQTLMMSRNDMTCPRCNTTNKFSKWKTIGPTVVCPSSKCGHPQFSACKECFIGWKFHKGFDCNAVKLLTNDHKHYQKCCGKLLVNDTDQKYPYRYEKCGHCPTCTVGVCFGCGARFGGGRHKCLPKQKQQKQWFKLELPSFSYKWR